MTNREKALQLMNEVSQIVLGKERVIVKVTSAFLADGHVLLEDVPGVGKTVLALAFSKAMGLEHKRVQFTPDVLPSDLTGYSVYQKETDQFIYRKGSVFCNLFLADEINRTSPKTQSALLEVMEEQKVTVDGITREVPHPFLVIATQNPFGSAGTHMLPGAQLDRFMICTSIGYPDANNEIAMAKGAESATKLEAMQPIITVADFLTMRKEVADMMVDDSLYEYIVALVTATRNHPYIVEGASPRATLALVKMSKASSWLAGKNYVTPKEVMKQFESVVYHRIQLHPKAVMDKMTKQDVIKDIINTVEKPRLWK